jgi:hypothetical protein
MSVYPSAAVMSGSEGRVHVRIFGENYFIHAEDLGALLFLHESVPLFRCDDRPKDPAKSGGFAHLNRSGRAVIFEFSKRCYQVHRDRFLGIALGEETSWPVAEMVLDSANPLTSSYPPGGDPF